MLLESLLAYAHFVAILSVVVFITSEAALCRAEWLSAAVVRRLARVDVIYLVAALAVLATGLARTWWGMKGVGWYWEQTPLFTQLTLFAGFGLVALLLLQFFAGQACGAAHCPSFLVQFLFRCKLALAAARLDSPSPLAVLGRGYSVSQKSDYTLVSSVDDLRWGDELLITVADGVITSVVQQVERR